MDRLRYKRGVEKFKQLPSSLQNDVLNAVNAQCAQLNLEACQVVFVVPTSDLNDDQWLALIKKASTVGTELEQHGWSVIY